MASSSRTIPHLLEPYLLRTETETADDNSPDDLLEPEPEPELVIATSVLGASTNWLILRYMYSFLKQQTSHQAKRNLLDPDGDHQTGKEISSTAPTTTSVVLVSFLRDFAFWRENAGRIGLDLDALTRTGRFAYVDGLGVDLFHSSSMEEKRSVGGNNPLRALSSSPVAGAVGRLPAARPNPIVPGRQPPGVGAIPLRGGPVSAASPQVQGPVTVLGAGGVGAGGRIPTVTSTAASPAPGTGGASSLSNPTISHLRSVISSAIEKVRSPTTTKTFEGTKPNNNSNRVVLIIDQLDFLLAASCGGFANSNAEVSTQALRELLLDLRETTSTTILTLSADQPLIDIEPQASPLEKHHANFVLSLLHEANLVLSLRLLDTGVARDVSGVIRITAGGGGGRGGGKPSVIEENEYLYHVRGDGSVRVFERGQ